MFGKSHYSKEYFTVKYDSNFDCSLIKSFMLKEKNGGIIIPVKVIPMSHRNEIMGWENGKLKVKIKAVAEKGNANEELVKYLAKYFHISPLNVILEYGAASRHKRIFIMGLTLKEVADTLSINHHMIDM